MTQNTQLTEVQIREIAREEARDVAGMTAADETTGEEWSVRRLIDRFELTRREAISAFGLIMIGVGAREAVARVLIGSAEAAPQDDLTVPGTLNAGSVQTDETTINDSLTASGLTLSGDPTNATIILDYLSSQHNSTLATSEDTVAGDNTATIIANLAPAASNNTDSFYTWIMGRKQGGAASFIDEVTLVGNDGLGAVNHQDSRNTVSRSYGSAVSGTGISLAIDDTGETYDVGVIMLGGGQKQ